jgi:uncharacterized protein YgbK (DUF1537 family)
MIGVVADDITGANDIGIMFAKSDYLTAVFSHNDFQSVAKKLEQQPEVIILDTNSRFDDPKAAYEKVFKATKDLQHAGADRFYNKTCSVFRGNIGVEFDAMLDALEEEFAVVVLGFPKNERKTLNGIHFVHGKKLENSEFRNDPMHPMDQSNLVDILQSQTKRKVSLIDHDVIKKGKDALKLQLVSLKKEYQYVILDVMDQNDLRTIASAVDDVRVLCGSSALAEELSIASESKNTSNHLDILPPFVNDKGLFSVAGSLMPQTIEQIQYMKNKGSIVLELDTLDLLERNREQVIQELASKVIRNLNEGSDVFLHSSNDAKTVQQTKDLGLNKGISNKEISQFVSSTIAEITDLILKNTGQNRLLVAGGDTSAAVCSKLGIRGMRVWKEIGPGLPSCLSLSEPPLLLVLKSGSFGKPNFFEQAIAHLKGQ